MDHRLQACLSSLKINVRPFSSLSATEGTNVYRVGVGTYIIGSEGVVKAGGLDDDLLVVVSKVGSDVEKACSKV